MLARALGTVAAVLGNVMRFAAGRGVPLAGAVGVTVGLGVLAHSVAFGAVVGGAFALIYDHRRP